MFSIFSDQQAVMGAFKATGSKEPDVLYAKKQEMTGMTRMFIIVSWILTIPGIAMSLTIIGAIIGIPMILGCWYIRRLCRNYVANVESAYAAYVIQVPLTN